MEQEYRYMVATRCLTFNHASYIEDAINGFVIQETTFPVVTIIVDDASTDGEPEVIKRYLTNHFQEPYRTEETDDYSLTCANHKTNPNCTFVVFLLKYNHYRKQKPKKPYFAEWLDNAKYHAICEGDDYWIDPNKLQMQVSFLEENPKCSLVHTRFDYYYVKTGVSETETKSHQFILSKSGSNYSKGFYILDNNRYRIQTATVMYSRQKYDKIRKLEMEEMGLFMMSDTQLWMNLLSVGDIHYLPNTTTVYRIMEESATRSTDLEKRIRFALSAAEMRYYYACKYKLNIGHFRRMYVKYLRMYLLFNKDYVSNPAIISYSLDPLTLSLKSSKILSLIGKKMLELYYSYR